MRINEEGWRIPTRPHALKKCTSTGEQWANQGFAAGWQAALEAADKAAGRVEVEAADAAQQFGAGEALVSLSAKELGAALVRDQIGKPMREGPPEK